MYNIITDTAEDHTTIRWSPRKDVEDADGIGTLLQKSVIEDSGGMSEVVISDDMSGSCLVIECREDADNLIKAIQKAIEWVWFNE